jgi:hypothetical protein
LRIERMLPIECSKINGLSNRRKGLAAYSPT